ncbi:MAG: MT-A70 family methyltransferase [Lentilitoribacter sp.]
MNKDQPYQVMPPPSAEDYKTLEESILSQGVLEPVLYEDNGFILDGHTREEICKKHGLDFPKNTLLGLSEEEKLEIAYDKNLARRHLTTIQKGKLVEARLIANSTLSNRAIANMLQVSKNTVNAARKRLEATGQIDQLTERVGEDGKTRKLPQPRKMQMLPPATKENTKIITDTAKAIRTAQKSAARQGNQNRLKAISEAMPKGEAGALPRKKFAVVYCDCPWEQIVYSKETGLDKAYPYPTMTFEDIMDLCAGDNSPALDDAVIFFWATANRVHIGIDVLRHWGFDIKTQFVWNKEHIGNGYWVRDKHEVLIIATRGKNPPPCPLPGEQADSLYSEKKGEHSAKPVHFAQVINDYYPDLPKLEMFQRESSLAPDDVRLNGSWTFWGNEASENGGDA